MEWLPIETAPKEVVRKDGHNCFGRHVLVAYGPVIICALWWERDDSAACNFIADGGGAIYPTHWMPLPPPPLPKEPA